MVFRPGRMSTLRHGAVTLRRRLTEIWSIARRHAMQKLIRCNNQGIRIGRRARRRGGDVFAVGGWIGGHGARRFG
jgi:hypothetical protein